MVMIVVALEGVHGCGKTELVKCFAQHGVSTIDEAFLDMPAYPNVDPQSVLMEMNWINSWFQRILLEASKHKTNQNSHFIVVDRSPFSAVFYTKNDQGRIFIPMIQAQLNELRLIGIFIRIVHVTCQIDVLWKRICTRLQSEPERALYKENSREWLDKVNLFYDQLTLYDFTVDNSEDGKMIQLMEQIKQMCGFLPTTTNIQQQVDVLPSSSSSRVLSVV